MPLAIGTHDQPSTAIFCVLFLAAGQPAPHWGCLGGAFSPSWWAGWAGMATVQSAFGLPHRLALCEFAHSAHLMGCYGGTRGQPTSPVQTVSMGWVCPGAAHDVSSENRRRPSARPPGGRTPSPARGCSWPAGAGSRSRTTISAGSSPTRGRKRTTPTPSSMSRSWTHWTGIAGRTSPWNHVRSRRWP